jgi:hypothetical protein
LGLADALVAQLSRPQVRTVDAESQPKGILLHPEARAYSKGLPGAAQTPIPLPTAPKPEAIPLQPRPYSLQSLLDGGGKLLASA